VGGLLVALLASMACASQPPAIVALSGQDLALLNRITWGANSSSAAALAKLGANGFIEQQLHPPVESQLPQAAQAQIEAMTISTTPVDLLAEDLDRQIKAANALADPEQKQGAQRAYQDAMNRVAREAVVRSLLRDLYSPNQLKEQLTWFWTNHFNVFVGKANIRALIADYEDRAIRPHALGHFRDLLAATLHHPAMLVYLDNNQNAAGHINENYAREIMELHTLGVDAGYTQNDVQELARILTGVGIAQPGNIPKLKPELQGQYVREGLFEFNPNRHDYGDKTFLGHHITGRGLAEVDEALDILSRAPATARFISRKLALFFCLRPSAGGAGRSHGRNIPRDRRRYRRSAARVVPFARVHNVARNAPEGPDSLCRLVCAARLRRQGRAQCCANAGMADASRRTALRP
jgi:uncharacterized protein (DUF1800 family)